MARFMGSTRVHRLPRCTESHRRRNSSKRNAVSRGQGQLARLTRLACHGARVTRAPRLRRDRARLSFAPASTRRTCGPSSPPSWTGSFGATRRNSSRRISTAVADRTFTSIDPPSERSTGLVFGSVALIIAVWWRHKPYGALGGARCCCWAGGSQSLCASPPQAAEPSLVSIRAPHARIVNPIVMLAVFAAVARWRHYGSSARPAQIKAHNRRLDLLDRAQGKCSR